MPKYKHLFFDLDHTIWDFSTNSKEAITEIFSSHQLMHVGVPGLASFLAEYYPINDRLWEKYTSGLLAQKVLRYRRFYETLLSFGIDDMPLAKRIAADYVRISPYKKALFPDAHEVLKNLQQRYSLHLITNGFSEVQEVKIKESKLESYFNEVITSEGAGVKKPDPNIFRYAFKKSGANVAESLMIGDSFQSDIEGAQNVGMDQVFFNPNHDSYQGKMPTYEIAALKQLLTFL